MTAVEAQSHRVKAPGNPLRPASPATLRPQVALLGTGAVGRAVMARLRDWINTPMEGRIVMVIAANSRACVHHAQGLQPQAAYWRNALAQGVATRTDVGFNPLPDVERMLHGVAVPVIIDATGSELVADHHAHWLACGIHVVTASKLGRGGSFARWNAIDTAARRGGASYGESATVGAGLPILSSIRSLRQGGDQVTAIAGVLSGSLAWLFDRYDDTRPFSTLVQEACAAGYMEPDPGEDLAGVDVRRKLLIVARAAGMLLDESDVAGRSLLGADSGLRECSHDDRDVEGLDARVHRHYVRARAAGEVLRFVARVDAGGAQFGLESLPTTHPLAVGKGTDNRVAIWSDRYCEQPLVIQGPGAGAGITAAALLDDVLHIANDSRRSRARCHA